jgi:hypothetical protein
VLCCDRSEAVASETFLSHGVEMKHKYVNFEGSRLLVSFTPIKLGLTTSQ